MKIIKLFVIVFLLNIFLISLSSLVNAVAVGGIYTEERHLEMEKGEIKEFSFVLQNRAGDKDIKLRANVSEGEEFVEIEGDKEYIVPLGYSNVSVKLTAKAPEDVKIGDEYQIRVDFMPMPYGKTEEGGMVQFALGISRAFKIKIIESEIPEEKPSSLGLIILIISIGIIILIVYFIFKIRKK